ITEDGYMIFNDTDAFGDTEVGVMRILDTALSTPQNQLGGSLDIYPNPTSDKITVFGLKVIKMKIYNNLGQLILEANNTNVLNVSSLLAGVYFIKITDGINFSTRKFIKK
ncbi:MAG: T9SS type A sorting domain-containing protein, partial [Bacteroidota bacterium]|nr:T9SS type A sorting domain-containing protein [Bacteroidota bacterium]